MLKKVQSISLARIPDIDFRREEYEMLGFTVKVGRHNMDLYWGKPDKPKKTEEDKDKKPERRSKTERRLGGKDHGAV